MLLEADEYRRLRDAAERLEDIVDAADAKAALARVRDGESETIPFGMVRRLSAGEHPLRVWRQHRGLSLAALAKQVGVSQPFLSNVENGKKNASFDVMAALAGALGVSLDDLTPWET